MFNERLWSGKVFKGIYIKSEALGFLVNGKFLLTEEIVDCLKAGFTRGADTRGITAAGVWSVCVSSSSSPSANIKI